MEKKGALQVYNQLPSWARGVVVVGGLAITYIFVNQIIKKLRLDAEKKKAEESLKQFRAELQQQIDAGVVPSYQKSVYDGYADALVIQFSGCDPGVASSTLNLLTPSAYKLYTIILELNNDRDFLELVDSFGTRTYDACGWWTGEVENVTLYGAVADELTQGEITTLNDTLRSRNINYTL
jgi:hypothetical protein